MKKDIIGILKNINAPKLKKTKSGLLYADKTIWTSVRDDSMGWEAPQQIIINGVPYYIKHEDANKKTSSRKMKYNNEIVTSRLYNNELSIPSTIYYPVGLTDNVQGNEEITDMALLSGDVNNLPGVIVTPAESIPGLQNFLRKISVGGITELVKNRGAFLDFKDSEGRYIFSESCYDDLINMYLADNLLLQKDRHVGNFFFYKTNPDGKYEGLITIDHERTPIVSNDFYDNPSEFAKYLKKRKNTFYSKMGLTGETERLKDRYKVIMQLNKSGRIPKKGKILEDFRRVSARSFLESVERDTGLEMGQNEKKLYETLIEHSQDRIS